MLWVHIYWSVYAAVSDWNHRCLAVDKEEQGFTGEVHQQGSVRNKKKLFDETTVECSVHWISDFGTYVLDDTGRTNIDRLSNARFLKNIHIVSFMFFFWLSKPPLNKSVIWYSNEILICLQCDSEHVFSCFGHAFILPLLWKHKEEQEILYYKFFGGKVIIYWLQYLQLFTEIKSNNRQSTRRNWMWDLS